MRLIPHLAIGLWASLLVTSAVANGLDARRTSEPGSAFQAPLAAPAPPPRVLLAQQPEPEPKGTPEVECGDPSDKPASNQAPTKVYAYEVFYHASKKKLEKAWH